MKKLRFNDVKTWLKVNWFTVICCILITGLFTPSEKIQFILFPIAGLIVLLKERKTFFINFKTNVKNYFFLKILFSFILNIATSC